MSTAYPDLFGRLCQPFPPESVRSRTQAGRSFHYITARTAMNRLDEVLGPENWKDEYFPNAEGMRCRISIRLPDQPNEWISREDGGASAGMAENDNDEKSAYSDAFKRAAVKWGVGRHLYQDGIPEYAGFEYVHYDGTPSRPPAHQPPATQRPSSPPPQQRQDPPQRSSPPQTGGDQPPRSGRALFAWVKKQEQDHGDGLLNHMNSWAKDQGLPGRMVDWAQDHVALAYAHARKVVAQKTRQPAMASVSQGESADEDDIPF